MPVDPVPDAPPAPRAGRGRDGGPALIVFAWHNVEGTWFFPRRPGAGRRRLTRQLATIGRLFTVMGLADAVARLSSGEPLPRRAAALTFDDGYRDHLEVAVPILERLRLPATFFLVPALLDGADAWWEEVGRACATTRVRRLDWDGTTLVFGSGKARARTAERVCERLKPRPRGDRLAGVRELVALLAPGVPPRDRLFMDCEGALRLARRPLAEIGSHSRGHDILSREPAADQSRDLAAARRALRSGLGVPVPGLAYPNGTPADYDERTVSAARDAGHEWAVTTIRGINRVDTSPFELRRVLPDLSAGAIALAKPWPVREWVGERYRPGRAAADASRRRSAGGRP